jgi:bifunctional UDP-N-acetylglucosamine pyrophosphorylase/glucosamine-1-phosphate N-acetyltransferase
MLEKTAIIIMAAGAGTRFKSTKSKLLHDLAGKPAIKYISDLVKKLAPAQSIFVLSYQKDEVKSVIGEEAGFYFVEQKVLDGTAGAVKAALKELNKDIERVLVIPGDTPNIPEELIRELAKQKDQVSLVGVRLQNPLGFGRIKTDDKNQVLSIIEQNDLKNMGPEDANINMVNTSIYSFDRVFLENNMSKIAMNKDKKEYYLTDIISIAHKQSLDIRCVEYKDAEDLIGPNDKAHFSSIAKSIWKKRAVEHALNGVNIIDLESVYIDEGVIIESDVTIYPNVFITGETNIESDVIILEGCRINNSKISKGSAVGPYVFIDGSNIGEENKLGPFTYVRPGTDTNKKVKIGGFVETKKIKVGEGSKIPHLSYVGDAIIGKSVNIGCGVITCNYDGFNKHQTKIGDNVFVGSDTQLVAPVELENDSYVGAGSTITNTVPSGALAISRVKQKNIEGYALKLKTKKSKK